MKPKEFDLEQCRQAWARLSETMDDIPPLSDEEVMRITRSEPCDRHKPSLLPTLAVAACVVLVAVGVLLVLRQNADEPSQKSFVQYAEAPSSAVMPMNPAGRATLAKTSSRASVTPVFSAKAKSVVVAENSFFNAETSLADSSQESASGFEELVCENWCESTEIVQELAYFCNNKTEGV